MNNKLIATLAALAIAAPLMGCAGDTSDDVPEQQDGVKQEAAQNNDPNAPKDQQKTDDQQNDEKLRQAEPNSCGGNAGQVGEIWCTPCGCFPY